MAQDMPAPSLPKSKVSKPKASSKKRARASASTSTAPSGVPTTSARGGVESSASSTVSSSAAKNAADDLAGPTQVQYIPRKNVDASDFGETTLVQLECILHTDLLHYSRIILETPIRRRRDCPGGLQDARAASGESKEGYED